MAQRRRRSSRSRSRPLRAARQARMHAAAQGYHRICLRSFPWALERRGGPACPFHTPPGCAWPLDLFPRRAALRGGCHTPLRCASAKDCAPAFALRGCCTLAFCRHPGAIPLSRIRRLLEPCHGGVARHLSQRPRPSTPHNPIRKLSRRDTLYHPLSLSSAPTPSCITSPNALLHEEYYT